VTHRKALAGDRQPDDNLWRIAPAVLRMPALARCGVALVSGRPAAVHHLLGAGALILFVNLEVQRGGVVEDDLHIQAQEVGHPEEDLPFDRLLVRLQEVHRAVQVLQRQPLGAGDARVFLQPLFVAVELGGRRADAVGHHRKERPLDVKAQPPGAGLSVEDLSDTQALPQRLQHIEVAIGPSAHQAPVGAIGHDLLGRAAAQDTLCQPAQPLDDRFILGASTVAKDARLGAALLGIPGVLGKLKVGDDTAVGAFLLGLTQVHVPNARNCTPWLSRHSGQSMYLWLCGRTGARLSRNQRITSAAPENVPRNCQSRV